MRGSEANGLPTFSLLELIAVGTVAVGGKIIQAILKVRPQIKAGFQPPEIRLALRARPALGPFAGQTVTKGLAASARIQRAVAVDRSTVDSALGDLVGRGPLAGIGHAGQRKTVVAAALAITQQAVQLAIVFLDLPRAIVVEQLQGIEQIAAAHFRRTSQQSAGIAVLAQSHLRQRAVDFAEIVDMRRPGRGKIALLGVIRPFAVSDAVDQLRDQKIEVGITLAVGMAGHIDRDAADVGGEISAVIEIEATQEILVGLAVAGMLGNDQPRHHFQRLTWTQDRHGSQALTGDHPFATGSRDAFEVFRLGTDFDGGQLGHLMRRSSGGCQGKI